MSGYGIREDCAVTDTEHQKPDDAGGADGHDDDLHISVDAEVVATPDEPSAASAAAQPAEPDAVAPPEPGADSRELGTAEIPKEIRQWAMFCHLGGLASYFIPFGGIVVPLILWQVKKDEHPFIEEQGKVALNFNITVAIAMFVCGLLIFLLIGILLLPLVAIGAAALSIMAALKANEGEHYRYPFSLHLVK